MNNMITEQIVGGKVIYIRQKFADKHLVKKLDDAEGYQFPDRR